MFRFFQKKKKVTSNNKARQQAVKYHEKHTNPDWPYEIKVMQADQCFQILNNSIDLISKTVYPATFFKRLQDIYTQAEMIRGFHLGSKYDKIINDIISEINHSKTEIIIEFIKRCDKSGKLPFVKNEILEHRSDMTSASLEYLNNLFATNDKTEYIY